MHTYCSSPESSSCVTMRCHAYANVLACRDGTSPTGDRGGQTPRRRGRRSHRGRSPRCTHRVPPCPLSRAFPSTTRPKTSRSPTPSPRSRGCSASTPTPSTAGWRRASCRTSASAARSTSPNGPSPACSRPLSTPGTSTACARFTAPTARWRRLCPPSPCRPRPPTGVRPHEAGSPAQALPAVRAHQVSELVLPAPQRGGCRPGARTAPEGPRARRAGAATPTPPSWSGPARWTVPASAATAGYTNRLRPGEPLRRLPAQPHRAVRPLARSHWRDYRGPGRVRHRRVPGGLRPIMSPGYVSWHPRVLDHQVSYGGDPDPGRLVLTVTLATALPLWLGSPWWSWTTYLGCDWSEPDEGRHAALGSLRLRWPLQVAALPRPHQPERPGYPNLPDAKASVRTLVDQINQTAGPVLAKLEGGERR